MFINKKAIDDLYNYTYFDESLESYKYDPAIFWNTFNFYFENWKRTLDGYTLDILLEEIEYLNEKLIVEFKC